MIVIAKLRHLRIAPRKVRLVADLIRGKKIEEAQKILNFTIKGASRPLFKLLKQATANAKNNFQLDPINLYVSRITVDEGPKLKRWMPRARGQTYEIQKKTSHITIILDELTKGTKKVKKAGRLKTGAVSEETIEQKKVEKILSEKPQQEDRFLAGKTKFKPKKELPKPKSEGIIKRIFRRKAI